METQSLKAAGVGRLILQVIVPESETDAYESATYPLPDRGQLTIGRRTGHDDPDVPIGQSAVSQRHASLHVDDGAVYVTDLGSKNGTFLNNRQLDHNRKFQLQPGDTLKVGTAAYLFYRRAAPAAPSPRPAGRRDDAGESTGSGLVLEDPAMRTLAGRLKHVAPATLSVLMTGETGTGKTVLARALHDLSKRPPDRFREINCAAMPRELIESTLFGHRKGAFTGATEDRAGMFEVTSGGTLFLDEIGECSLELQAKLLTAVEGTIVRVGDTKSRPVDVRLVSATNADLWRKVTEGKFREDLYYRVAGITFRVPPLRERPADIPKLVDLFVARVTAKAVSKVRPTLTADAYAALARWPWPGNVRELQNGIERLLTLAESPTIRAADVESLIGPLGERPSDPVDPVVSEKHGLTLSQLRRLLDEHRYNASKIARQLGASRNSVAEWMKRWKIPSSRDGG